MKEAILHRGAKKELDKAVAYNNRKRPGLGQGLLDEVLAALGKLESDPGIGARYRNTTRRFYRLKRFRYVIYYAEFEKNIWIAAIAHERRRPGYWRRRKPE